jgi:hypothetical protein
VDSNWTDTNLIYTKPFNRRSQPKVYIMKKSTLFCIGLAAFAGLVSTGCARAATKTIVLKEQLNQKWTNELLSYPFEAANGQATADSVAVSGPKGAVPAQLENIEYWPNTRFVKTARLLFVEPDLEPLTSETYTVSDGTAAATQPASDLKVTSGDGFAELSTSRFAAQLRLGEKSYATPAAPQDVPGPLLAWRAGNGAWEGGSTLAGEGGVKSWSAKLVESGPVRARVVCRYVLADDASVTFTASAVAGDDKVLWEIDSSQDHPQLGVDFQLGKIPGLKQASVPKTWGQWGKPHTIALTPAAQPFAFLSPNTSVANGFPDGPSSIEFGSADGPDLRIVARDPGAWADPAKPFTYGGYEKWNLDMIPLSWDRWKRKRLPLTYAADGAIGLRTDFAAGRRLWSVGSGEPVVGERLNEVKEMVLDWPSAAGAEHPSLFMSKAEVEAAWKKNTPDAARVKSYAAYKATGSQAKAYLASNGDAEIARADAVPALLQQLGLLGDYDVMRGGIAAAGLYDALIDSSFVTPQQRTLLRAQMAYLGYVMADPMMWSIERGYHSGNPNMSISYTLTLGIVACAIPDHPMAKTWSDYATRWMDKWLTDEVGANGEWLPEGGHYGQVSWAPLVAYAIAAKRAGFHDFTNDPRLKKLSLYFAKMWTPPDPQRKNARVSPPIGRGTAGDTNGIFGVLARMTAESDPAFSRAMQWMWKQNNEADDIGDWRLGGYESTYLDRDLPAEKPAWRSELFPSYGAVLRDAFGHAAEDYVNVIATTDSLKNLDIWTPEIGNIAAWYAFGQPISKQFSFAVGYNERHELLHGGVTLSHNWGAPGDSKTPFGYYTSVAPQGFAALPRADYVAATYHFTKPDDRDWFPDKMPAFPRVKPATAPVLDWTRQTLFVKDDSAAGPHYIVVRDTTSGGQPTTWQFWTLSEKIGTPAEMQDAAFLNDKPGAAILPARELPAGDRYTALGQFGVDLESYVAAPTSTPRATLRYGGEWLHVPEYQDLLQLQLPGDGAYFVALFPREHAQAAPNFSTLGDGKIIKVAGAFGTDYDFLSRETSHAAAEGATFDGTAASVQNRAGTSVLTLNAPGAVAYKQYSLAADGAASLRVAGKTATVNLGGTAASTHVTLDLPGNWKLAKKVAGVEWKRVGNGRYQLTAPRGVTELQLLG